jgi:hypothetical protein
LRTGDQKKAAQRAAWAAVGFAYGLGPKRRLLNIVGFGVNARGV